MFEVSRVFQRSFKGVYRKFQGCFKEVSKVFQGSFKNVSRKFPGNFKGVQKHFKGISSKIEGHFQRYKGGLRVFERSLNGVSRGLQGSFVSRKFQEIFKVFFHKSVKGASRDFSVGFKGI